MFLFFLNVFLFLFSMHLDFLLYLFEVLIIYMLKILSDFYLLVWWAYPTWQVGKMVLKLIEFTAIHECCLFSPKHLPRRMGFSLSFHPDSKQKSHRDCLSLNHDYRSLLELGVMISSWMWHQKNKTKNKNIKCIRLLQYETLLFII